jgi:hypothetical protein
VLLEVKEGEETHEYYNSDGPQDSVAVQMTPLIISDATQRQKRGHRATHVSDYRKEYYISKENKVGYLPYLVRPWHTRTLEDADAKVSARLHEMG